jgi:hypothetical protein
MKDESAGRVLWTREAEDARIGNATVMVQGGAGQGRATPCPDREYNWVETRLAHAPVPCYSITYVKQWRFFKRGCEQRTDCVSAQTVKMYWSVHYIPKDIYNLYILSFNAPGLEIFICCRYHITKESADSECEAFLHARWRSRWTRRRRSPLPSVK